MPLKRLRKLSHSVFTKLLLVILICGLLLNLMVFGFFKHIFRDRIKTPLNQNIIQYINYIINDLGTPPSLARARQIAHRSSMQIRYIGPDQSWMTADEKFHLAQKHAHVLHNDSVFWIGVYRGRYFILKQTPAGEFIFSIGRKLNVHLMGVGELIFLISIMSAFLIGAYLIIRKILTPIKWLSEGVHQISTGNLKHDVPLKRADELGDLAKAFNDMRDRINQMLTSRERLLLDVSHELRTPLTRMKVALEFLEDGRAKANIKEDVFEMEQMITEILESARLHNTNGRMQQRATNVVALIKETVRLFESQAPGIQTDDLPQELVLNIDPDLIKTVLKNIFNNALKYSNADNAPINVSTARTIDGAIIKIKDHGIGIPTEELPHVFEPFYRVDKSRTKRTGGYGLGLSLCKTIMEAHNGRILIDSGPDAGTTVSLIFPVA